MPVKDPKLDAIFGATDVDQIVEWRKPKTPSAQPAKRWDRNPVRDPITGGLLRVKGVEYEFFLIGALAEALGRKTVTIRSWEDKKIFPKPLWRLPPVEGTEMPNKTAKGRRLYSRGQIEAAISCARASGVYDPANALNANWTEFTRLVREAWLALGKDPSRQWSE